MTYTEKDIKILEGLDPVRKRPGMYIGSTDENGLHHLIWEIFDNSIDEVISGECTKISVVLNNDNSIQITDNGRGIPYGINEHTKLSTIDTVFTKLHAGGKFDDTAYKTAGGLHGVGASVVNALSEWMKVVVKRNEKIMESKYEHGGKIIQACREIGKTNETGTSVTFLPDKKIFPTINFNPEIIKNRLQESSFLYKKLLIIFTDKKNNNEYKFQSANGIVDYIAYINKDLNVLNKTCFLHDKHEDIETEIAFQYTTLTEQNIISFANSIKTKEGGSHENGFKLGISECINEFSRASKMLKEKEKNFEGEDIREGITAIISVRVPEKLIQYEGQTKNKLFTPLAAVAVKKTITKKLPIWLNENKKDFKIIIQKIISARDARLAAKNARENLKNLRDAKSNLLLYGKLTPAQSRDYKKNELFLVEGNSAGGTAKLARDKHHQAILPLRGKVINAEKVSIKDLLNNEEICSIISCIGGGYGNDFNIDNIKYGKIIIMTDADTDGAHIQVLLLTFFYRFMKKIIENDCLFVALPPLFKFTDKKTEKFKYFWNEESLEEEKKKISSYEIQRYKGLGEMDANQLRETTMNDNRNLIKVTINDAMEAEKYVNIIMGDNAALRKDWINANVNFELDNK